MLQNDFWRFQKPNIRSRSKNSSRAMFLSCSDNSFGPGTRNASNGFLEVPKTRYSVQTQKQLARHVFEPFWQQFWARNQKCLKTALCRFQKPDIWCRPPKNSRATFLNSSGNSFGPGTRNVSNRLSGGSKNEIFGPDQKQLSRYTFEPFWQWLHARSQKCFKTIFWRCFKTIHNFHESSMEIYTKL